MSAWLFPISTAKCCMNSPQAADVALAWTEVSAASLDCEDCVADGRKPKLIPAAEAVATTAIPAMATAPTAKPAARRWSSFQTVLFMRPLSHGDALSFFMHLLVASLRSAHGTAHGF